MGMSISAKLMYGMFYDELIEELCEDAVEELNELLEDGDIDHASPTYDAPRDEWFVGYELGEMFDYELVDSFVQELRVAEETFKERFGVTGNVRACQHVY